MSKIMNYDAAAGTRTWCDGIKPVSREALGVFMKDGRPVPCEEILVRDGRGHLLLIVAPAPIEKARDENGNNLPMSYCDVTEMGVEDNVNAAWVPAELDEGRDVTTARRMVRKAFSDYYGVEIV